jgi:hypothetical protein
MDTRVFTCPTYNQQTINVKCQLSCHRWEYFTDYNRHQDRKEITVSSVEGVIVRSAPEHTVRDSKYEIIPAQDDKGHCQTKVLDGFKTLRMGQIGLSRNVGKKLPFCTA